MSAFERLVDKLRDEGKHVRDIGTTKAMAQSPAHDDNTPSLSVTSTETRARLHCFANCDDEDILDALGMTVADLFNEPRTTYDYRDTSGAVQRSVVRFYEPGKDGKLKKTFRPAGGDVKAFILYRLPEVVAAIKAGQTIYLAEGEEDVHALETQGFVATTGPQGAQAFGKVDVTPLKGATVVAVVDKDDTGQKWADIVKDNVGPIAASPTFVEAMVGKDVADHIAADHGVEDLVELEDEDDKLLALVRTGDWLDAQVFPPTQWAVPGLTPEGFGLLTGAPKIGKSWAALGIGLAVALGGQALGKVHTGQPRPVLYFALEDGDARLQWRGWRPTSSSATPAYLGGHI